MAESLRVVIRGGGDLGTGVALRLWRAGCRVAILEAPQPTVIRRAVAFASAVYEWSMTVEGATARLADSAAEVESIWRGDEIPVLIDPDASLVEWLQAEALIDAILAKRNLGTRIDDAPIVVALGPGFTAGVDCHAVIETNRGHNLGRVYYSGSAEPNTGMPGTIGGQSAKRALRAPIDGVFRASKRIGDRVSAGEAVAQVETQPVIAEIAGVLRGILYDGLAVTAGMKVADVDPRGVVAHCFSVSDKAWAVGGGALEAVLHLKMLRATHV